ncbi:MAG: hypothetical protein EBR28_04725 [Planctomycetia bacterium]|nr:hypothetical protein [Planctomycetia bacterium]
MTRLWLSVVAACCIGGCAPSSSIDPERVMIDTKHSHFHVHGPGIEHGHVHAGFVAGGHTHEHDGH